MLLLASFYILLCSVYDFVSFEELQKGVQNKCPYKDNKVFFLIIANMTISEWKMAANRDNNVKNDMWSPSFLHK